RRARDAGAAASGDDASEISLLGRGRDHLALARAVGLCPRRRSRRGAHGIFHNEGGGRDMAAYIIGLRRSAPRGTAWVKEYLPKTGALIAKHGGKALIGGNSTPR